MAAELKPSRVNTFFFVCGHPRSGTNWVSNLINLHPKAYCRGEFHFHILRQAFDQFAHVPWHVASKEPVRSVAEACFHETVSKCLLSLTHYKPGATALGDHTPRILRAFVPSGRHIVITRDGRDVLVSWTHHLLKTGEATVVQPNVRGVFEEQLSKLIKDDASSLSRGASALLGTEAWVKHYARGWAMHVRCDMQAKHALDGAMGSPDAARVMHLTYEALHGDTDGKRRTLYAFLGLDPNEAEPLSRESKTSAGFGREDPSSFYRKGEVGDWRNHLRGENRGWFASAAQSELQELGYEPDDSWTRA
jgi:hypothetical protein